MDADGDANGESGLELGALDVLTELVPAVPGVANFREALGQDSTDAAGEVDLFGESGSVHSGGAKSDEEALGGMPGEGAAGAEAVEGENASVAIAVVEEAASALSSSSSAASSSAPAYIVANTSPDGLLTVSTLGYVRCSRPPHDGQRPIGLVGRYSDGRSKFASCHLHPACNVRVGVVLEGVDDLRLAEWLALGIPCPPGLSRAQKHEFTRKHRPLWARYGAFGSQQAGAELAPP